MISKPEAYCPRCGSRLTVMDAIDVNLHAETVTYYCECDCGAANLAVSQGKVISITPCSPIDLTSDLDEPIADSPEYEEYLAQ